MKANIDSKAGRLFPIDFLKAASITAVVSFHSIFVPQSTYQSAAYLMEALFTPLRFCVPVFLTISFFLLKRGLEKSANEPVYPLLKKRLIRLFIPIMFWFTLGAIVQILNQTTAAKLIIAIFQGNVFNGAYYLLIMLQLLPIFVWKHQWFSNRKNVLIALIFQALFFLLTYTVLLGIFGISVKLILYRISRPLFAYYLVYLALGAYLYTNWSRVIKFSTSIPRKLKIFLLSLTSLIMIAEYSCLRWATGERLSPFEYVMFSCIFSVIVGFLCFANIQEDRLSIPVQQAVQLLSKYSLGIFCLNGLLSYVGSQMGAYMFEAAIFTFPEILAIKLVGWSLLLAVSLGMSILLDRVGLGACVR